MIYEDRIETANKIISLLLPKVDFCLQFKNNRLFLSYSVNKKPKLILVRLKKNQLVFQCRKLLVSHVEENAIALLVRWIRDDHEKHGDIRLWQKWAKMGLTSGDVIVNILLESGYPKGD